MKIDSSPPGALEQVGGNNPAGEIGNDVIALPGADLGGERIAPTAQAKGHASEALLTEFEGALTVRIICFAEEEERKFG